MLNTENSRFIPLGHNGQLGMPLLFDTTQISAALTPYTCILKVPSSILGRATNYPNCRGSWFSSVYPGECGDSTFRQVTTVSFQVFTHHSHQRPIRC